MSASGMPRLESGGGYESWLEPVVSLEVAKKRFEGFRQIVAEFLVEEVDYGMVGTANKPSLLKPGAEKLCMLYGLSQTLELIDKVEDWGENGGEPLFFYRYSVTLRTRNGHVAGVCEGACTSREKKYRYRKGGLTCPVCGVAALIKSKFEPDTYYCYPGKDGCKSKFSVDDPEITDQEIDTNLNPDVADQVNTFIKMAIKRALIGAVLIATAASDFFTQDLEDQAEGKPRNRRQQQPQRTERTEPQQQQQPQQQRNGEQAGNTQQTQPNGAGKVGEARGKRFFAKAMSSGRSKEEINAYLHQHGFERTEDITVDVYEEACRWADQAGPADPMQQPRPSGPQRRSSY